MSEIKDINDELIIIDGGMDEDTNAVIAEFGDLVDKHIREVDRNEAHALNKGILASSGDLIKPFTDDDYLYPTGMQFAKAVFEERPEVMMLQCGGISVRDESPDTIHAIQQLSENQSIDNPEQSYRASCGLGLVFRKEVISIAGLFDTSLQAIDNDYLARCIYLNIGLYYADVKLFKHITWSESAQLNVDGCLRGNIQRALRYGSFLSVFEEDRRIAYFYLRDYKVKNLRRWIIYWSHWSLHEFYSHWYNIPFYIIIVILLTLGTYLNIIIRHILNYRNIIDRRARNIVRKILRRAKRKKYLLNEPEWTGLVMKLGRDIQNNPKINSNYSE